ncbi:MAG: PLP-dependent transferase [Actinobacteria bacterium]|nr:PLP-dependent transferase [Actinomycetota bacterium]
MALDRSTIWPYVDGAAGELYYSRYDHPAGLTAERALGKLDGGRALLYSSGAAASTALVLGLLEPGQTIALAGGGYYGTPLLLAELRRFGVEHVEFDQAGRPPEGADLIWLEAPSNPFLTFPDLPAAAEHPARVVVDATASTPVLLRPLEHGADLVLHSATKYLGGHSDVLLGALVCRSDADWEQLKRVRGLTGPIAGPDAAWLMLRGLKTLELRVLRQSETALELAHRLDAHPGVELVRYPGLGNPLAARFMQGGFGGLLSFDVASGDAARTLETSTRVIKNATSLGGVESSIESRHRWEGDRVPEGLLRLSAGLEDVDELWADLEQALARVPERSERRD